MPAALQALSFIGHQQFTCSWSLFTLYTGKIKERGRELIVEPALSEGKPNIALEMGPFILTCVVFLLDCNEPCFHGQCYRTSCICIDFAAPMQVGKSGSTKRPDLSCGDPWAWEANRGACAYQCRQPSRNTASQLAPTGPSVRTSTSNQLEKAAVCFPRAPCQCFVRAGRCFLGSFTSRQLSERSQLHVA